MWQYAPVRRMEHLVPQSVKQALLPTLLPGRNPFGEANHRHRAIFVHIPKTAGTSICRALGNTEQRHAPLSRYAAYDPVRTSEYFKFCFVRNPWERLLSAHSYLRGCETDANSADGRWSRRNLAPLGDFESFVRALTNPLIRLRLMSYPHFLPQYVWITLPGGYDITMDHIGRFETLEADFSMIAKRLCVDIALPRLRHSGHSPYRYAYSAETRGIVSRMYAQDISTFGYAFDGGMR